MVRKDEDYGPGYKQTKMFVQFGKIEDSQENPTPLDSVKTDDGKVIKVTLDQAKKLKLLEMSFRKPIQKMAFADEIQYSEGLSKWLNSAVLELIDVKTEVSSNSIYS